MSNCGLQNNPTLFQHLANIQQYLTIHDNARNNNIQKTQGDNNTYVESTPKVGALTLLLRRMLLYY